MEVSWRSYAWETLLRQRILRSLFTSRFQPRIKVRRLHSLHTGCDIFVVGLGEGHLLLNGNLLDGSEIGLLLEADHVIAGDVAYAFKQREKVLLLGLHAFIVLLVQRSERFCGQHGLVATILVAIWIMTILLCESFELGYTLLLVGLPSDSVLVELTPL